jgi:hypothetical protein
MFRQRKGPFAARCHRVEIEPMQMPTPMYDDEPTPDPVTTKKKKNKYLPGERLLIELHKKEKERSNNLDMSSIHRSIRKIIDEIAE